VDVGEELAGWGKVALLETRGRVSGRTARAAVGFVEEPDGSLLVSAASDDTQWARNLLADGTCRVTIGDRAGDMLAEALEGSERATAIRGLILKYGTPAERLGRGPAFRLRPRSVGDRP
jgi:deazaflavin-dependent oxidoreductase (nitroreductase family)